jgi:penicillin-binding protein 2
VLGTLFFILTTAFYQLQITEGAVYLQSSSSNVIRQKEILPTRGDIYDRNGKIIVDNRPAFSLYVSPKIIKADTTIKRTLADVLNDSTLDFKRIYKRRYASSERVLLKRHISNEEMARIIENKPFLDGVYIESDPRRNHHDAFDATHVVGYVSEVSDELLKTMVGYKAGDQVGRNGLEMMYEEDLFGEKGSDSQIYDALGNPVASLGAEMTYSVPEVDGHDLYTTIDSRIQFVAESLLIDKTGSIVVLDTRDGGVLAMASSPSYAPELRTKPIPQKVWDELLDPKNKNPFLNRAIQGRYPPGSTYKMVAAITALNERLVTPDWTVTCEGYVMIGNQTVRCWNHKGHGEMNLLQAIRSSCNIYFYSLGLKIGLEKWEAYSKAFQFGKKTNIDLPRESDGLVPSVDYYKRRYPGGHRPGHLAILAIGQGELLTTPLQMAQFMMILANRGTFFQPHFLKGFSEKYKNDVTLYPAVKKQIPIEFKKAHWDLIRRGMFNAVNSKYGATAWRTRLPDVDIAGKTGTAQVPPNNPHSWFTGFAPYENPEIAVVVIIENGGSGGGVATGIARALFEQHFYGFVKRYVYVPPVESAIIEIPDLVVPKIVIPAEIDLERED